MRASSWAGVVGKRIDRKGRDKVGAAMTAGKALADDLRGKAKIGRTARAAKMRDVACEEGRGRAGRAWRNRAADGGIGGSRGR